MEVTVKEIKEMMKAEGLKFINKTTIGNYAKEKGFKKKSKLITFYLNDEGKRDEESGKS